MYYLTSKLAKCQSKMVPVLGNKHVTGFLLVAQYGMMK